MVLRNNNYLSESLRDTTGVLPIRQQKINALQSSFRLIPMLHFLLSFIVYIGAKMMQINNKLQKWKYKASVLNKTATLVFRWGTHLYMSLFLAVRLYVCPSVCPSVCLSIRLSVAHHISGTIHHLIIILGHLCEIMISPGCFFIFF